MTEQLRLFDPDNVQKAPEGASHTPPFDCTTSYLPPSTLETYRPTFDRADP
jgi:hypothetical protein